jgi:hypothetical protein
MTMHGEVKILMQDGSPCEVRLTPQAASEAVRARYDAQDRQALFRDAGLANSWDAPQMPPPYQRIRYRNA